MALNPPRAEQTARPDQQNQQEGQMPSEDLPFRIDRRAERLGDADDDATGKRPPQRAETADDDRLEGIDSAAPADGRIEVGARAEIECGDRHHHHGDARWRWQRSASAGCPSDPQ